MAIRRVFTMIRCRICNNYQCLRKNTLQVSYINERYLMKADSRGLGIVEVVELESASIVFKRRLSLTKDVGAVEVVELESASK